MVLLRYQVAKSRILYGYSECSGRWICSLSCSSSCTIPEPTCISSAQGLWHFIPRRNFSEILASCSLKSDVPTCLCLQHARHLQASLRGSYRPHRLCINQQHQHYSRNNNLRPANDMIVIDPSPNLLSLLFSSLGEKEKKEKDGLYRLPFCVRPASSSRASYYSETHTPCRPRPWHHNRMMNMESHTAPYWPLSLISEQSLALDQAQQYMDGRVKAAYMSSSPAMASSSSSCSWIASTPRRAPRSRRGGCPLRQHAQARSNLVAKWGGLCYEGYGGF